jgi:hypothetical protein
MEHLIALTGRFFVFLISRLPESAWTTACFTALIFGVFSFWINLKIRLKLFPWCGKSKNAIQIH